MSRSRAREMRRVTAAVTASLAIALVALTLMTAGCGSGPPEDPPGIVGTITSLTRAAEAGTGGLVILVEAAEPDPSFVADKASVRVPEDTPVYDADGEKTALSALVEGVEVRVWFTGAVAESYPVQGQAAAVQLVGP